MPNRPWIVAKFGGTSVSTLARWDTIADVVRRHRDAGRHPLLVCSALSGISDQLDGLLNAAESGSDLSGAVAAVKDRHRQLGRDLGVDAEAVLADAFDQLDAQVEAVAEHPPARPKQRAAVMAMGELMSTRLGAAFLSEEGLSTRWLDAREYL